MTNAGRALTLLMGSGPALIVMPSSLSSLSALPLQMEGASVSARPSLSWTAYHWP